MDIIEINQLNFDDEVINTPKTVVVDFYANWCMPCKEMAKTVEEIANRTDDNVKVTRINIDENQDLASQYEIMSIPTIKIFKNGIEMDSFVGVQPIENIMKSL